MPPLSSAGYCAPTSGARPVMRELPGGDLVDQRVVQVGVLAQRQADVLLHRQRAEQAAVLEHHAPAPAQRERLRRASSVGQVDAEHADRARVRALQQDHLAQQRRLARAAAADQREDLARGAPRGRCRCARHGRRSASTPCSISMTASSARASASMSEVQRAEGDREQRVGDDHEEDRLHHAARGLAARRCRRRRGCESPGSSRPRR